MDEFSDSHRVLLGKLVGRERIRVDDPFWLELFGYSGQLSNVDPQQLLDFLLPYCKHLSSNTFATGNYQCAVWHVVQHLSAAGAYRASTSHIRVACNGVRLLTSITSHLLKEVSERNTVKLFTSPHSDAETHDVLAQLVSACLNYVTDTAVSATSYALYHSVLLLLIVLCSTQLYCDQSLPGLHPPLEALHTTAADHGRVVAVLLQLHIDQPLPTNNSPLYNPSPSHSSSSMVGSLTKAATDLVLLPWRTISLLYPNAQRSSSDGSPIGDAALLLLLLLVHYQPPSQDAHACKYKLALQSLQNSEATSLEDAERGRAGGAARAVPLSLLFDALTERVGSEATLLLLYNLLVGCPALRDAVLVRSDIDRLIVPLLQQLYTATPRSPHHLYVLQIIVLILSQDEALSKSVHKLRLARVPWYTERQLHDVTLGSLLFVVLLRTALHNLLGSRDVYLHTNTLAALANLVPHAVGLDSHATHRLMMVLEAGRKRLRKLIACEATAPDAIATERERQLVEDFLKTVVEVTDSLIVHALPKNPELVYSLLHRQEVLRQLAAEPAWGERLHNVCTVLDHFNARIDRAQGGDGGDASGSGADWSAGRVLEIIELELRTWKPQRLRPVSDIKFTYEESANAAEFFLPYVWSLVLASPHVAAAGHHQALPAERLE